MTQIDVFDFIRRSRDHIAQLFTSCVGGLKEFSAVVVALPSAVSECKATLEAKRDDVTEDVQRALRYARQAELN